MLGDRLETTGQPEVSDKYPQPNGMWPSIPNNIDSAFAVKNNRKNKSKIRIQRTYLFNENTYYRLDYDGPQLSSFTPSGRTGSVAAGNTQTTTVTQIAAFHR